MSRFYYGCVNYTYKEVQPGIIGKVTVRAERNFITDQHPGLFMKDVKYESVVFTFCQEISEDMYALLKDKGHFCLDELSPTDPV